MKKILALLVALSIVVVCVSAQDAVPEAKLIGSAESGLVIKSTEIGKNNVFKLKVANAFLGGTIDTPDYGVLVKFKAEAETNSFSVERAFVTAKLFDAKVITKAGKMDEGATVTDGDFSMFRMDGEIGMSLVALPMEGLAVSYLLPLNSTGGETTNQLCDSKAGIKYTMKDIVTVAAGVDGSPKGMDDSLVGASVKLLSIPNLTLVGEAKMYLAADTNQHAVFEKVGYQMDKLYAGVMAWQFVKNGDSADAFMKFKPEANYDFGTFKLGGNFEYSTTKVTVDGKAGTWSSNVEANIHVGTGNINIGGDVWMNNKDNCTTSDTAAGQVYLVYSFSF